MAFASGSDWKSSPTERKRPKSRMRFCRWGTAHARCRSGDTCGRARLPSPRPPRSRRMRLSRAAIRRCKPAVTVRDSSHLSGLCLEKAIAVNKLRYILHYEFLENRHSTAFTHCFLLWFPLTWLCSHCSGPSRLWNCWTYFRQGKTPFHYVFEFSTHRRTFFHKFDRFPFRISTFRKMLLAPTLNIQFFPR